MDYMNLGVTARKTGIKIQHGIRKDEFSMESVDEFFKEDESYISTRRRSRKSSLLPLQQPILPEGFTETSRRSSNFLPPSIPTIYEDFAEEPAREALTEDVFGGDFDEAQELIEEQELSHIQVDRSERRPTTKTRRYEPDYRTDEESFQDEALPQTPASDYGNESYRDVPDLVADDEDEPSHGNTTFNTSDNALLEDELDRDYELQSEEDGDYVEEQRYRAKRGFSESEDEDNASGRSSSNEHGMLKNTNQSILGRPVGRKGLVNSDQESSVDEKSDDEFIQDQAQELGQEVNYSRVNGVRKSNRVKIAPLEYWRNEKVVYKRKSRKPVLEIDKVITYEEDEDEEEEMLRKRKMAKKRPFNFTPSGRPRGRPRKNQDTIVDMVDGPGNPNQTLIAKISTGQIRHSEWVKQGVYKAKVNTSADHTQKEEDVLAYSDIAARPEHSRHMIDGNYSLTVLFDKYRESFASGFLTLPVGSRKKPSDSHNVFINFYLIQGVLEITIGENTLICTEGSSFQIPAYNEYALINKGKNIAKMYFVQVTIPNTHTSSLSEPVDKPSMKGKEDTSKDPRKSLSDMSISQS
ncbi:LANO_0D06128g1_1 [Lachancea nothofagi CBS 11611]|uniref:LANO_0D06128g1_1 n=1 Tax=Lachancea nothofagi CBS 11611 TaxID=1266666 RepID=A0A1G4JH50_9SACH|nr:LANO_0D06128g1_1 [Lachancea nothofagi CBS 11611]